MLNRLPRMWSIVIAALLLGLTMSASVLAAAKEDAKAERKAAKVAARADAEGPWNAARTAETAARIDALVAKGYESIKVEATRLTSDTEFVRRIYLDISGTIPNLDQTEAFLISRDPDKRAKLIDALMRSPGYVSNNYNYWADLLRVKGRTRGDAGNDYGKWVKQSIQDNKPYDQFVYELITADGQARHNGAAGYWLRDDGMVLDILSNTARNFLGTQIGCAQCHDHPFDVWTQKDFYEMGAYVAGVTTRMRPGYNSTNPRQAMQEGLELRKLARSDELDNRTRQVLQRILRESSYGVQDTPKTLRYPNDYKYSNAKPNEVAKTSVIFGQSASVNKGDNPREVFAKWVTARDNPRFTAVIANRMWKKVTGMGIVEPIDDWHDDTKGTNPELLAYLTNLMIDVGYDLKQFQRILYNTKTYQLSAGREELAPEVRRNQSALLRRMSAEQLWDSLLTLAVESPDTRTGVGDIGDRFGEVLDKVESAKTAKEVVAIAEDLAKNPRQMLGGAGGPNAARRGAGGVFLVRASEMPQPAPPGTFLEQFGQADRETSDSATTDPSVPQVLALLNGPVTQMLLRSDSVLMKNVARAETPREKIETIYLSMLSRKPYSGELSIATQEIARNGDQGYANLIWAIANTREFVFVQ